MSRPPPHDPRDLSDAEWAILAPLTLPPTRVVARGDGRCAPSWMASAPSAEAR
jgi:hypothetical protein